MTFDILPWFRASKSSSHYASLTQDNQSKYYGEAPGASSIIHEALSVAAKTYDLSKYDSNNDGCIDALYIIYNHPIMHNDTSFWWAFQYFTFEDYKFDGLYSYNYVFSSFDFLFEDQKNNNPRPLIHESGHIFGLEDYYNTSSSGIYQPTGFADMMDANIGDHTGLSKMKLNWVTPKVIKEEGEITLSPFHSSGDLILIPTSKGYNNTPYDEYLLLDDVTVNIHYSGKLVSTNADKKADGVYTWYINKDNYNNKKIYLESEVNKENNILDIVGGIVFGVLLLVAVIIVWRYNKKNNF